jgi:hypothetical protein
LVYLFAQWQAIRDVYARASMLDNGDVYIETRIEVTAAGRPEWEREEEKEKFFVDLAGC